MMGFGGGLLMGVLLGGLVWCGWCDANLWVVCGLILSVSFVVVVCLLRVMVCDCVVIVCCFVTGFVWYLL